VRATVVITTKDRKDELPVAVRSALEQSVRPEVLVIDDGSTDGTSAMVRSTFPQVRLIRHEESRGYISRRNEGARTASGDVMFSIDDDAAFSTPRAIQQTLEDFSSERVGAVAIPYVDVLRDEQVRQMAPDSKSVYVTDSYIGTAHAVRRDVFLRLGGYREHLIHQGEEGDFCIRMLNAGYVVRLGNADPIHHFESPKRNLSRMDFYGARNAVLLAWQNVPFPFLLAHLPVTTVRCLLLTLQPDRFKTRLSGLIDGYRQCFRRRREPVSWSAYRLARTLRKKGPKPLTELDLPPFICPSEA
jgi:glycosyltransferase involved in cell wall biosynthesis